MEVIIVDLPDLKITSIEGRIHIKLPYTSDGEPANADEKEETQEEASL